MSERTGIEVESRLCVYDSRNPSFSDVVWGWDSDEIPVPREKGCACDNCFYGRDQLAMEIIALREQIALSRAESAITEGDWEKIGRFWINTFLLFHRESYASQLPPSRRTVDEFFALIRSRKSGAITEGDDWWGDPFGEWHPNQQPESILPCGIYIRLRFEHDIGYSYNSLDIVIEEENLTTSDIEEPWIGPFPSWIFRSRQSGEQRKWISVDERLPEKNTPIFIRWGDEKASPDTSNLKDSRVASTRILHLMRLGKIGWWCERRVFVDTPPPFTED